MKRWILERVLWTIAGTAGVATVVLMVLNSRASSPGETPLPSMKGVQMYDAAQLLEAADHLSSTDSASLDREDSGLIPDAPMMAPRSEQVTPPFQLQLSGVSGGPPWRAIVSGIPGRDGGVVVSAGDTLGGIKVRAIKRDTLIVQTSDSTMTLTLRR